MLRWSCICEVHWRRSCTREWGPYCQVLQGRSGWNAEEVWPWRGISPCEPEILQRKLAFLRAEAPKSVSDWDSNDPNIRGELTFELERSYLQKRAGKLDFSWSCPSRPGSAVGWRSRVCPTLSHLSARSATREWWLCPVETRNLVTWDTFGRGGNRTEYLRNCVTPEWDVVECITRNTEGDDVQIPLGFMQDCIREGEGLPVLNIRAAPRSNHSVNLLLHFLFNIMWWNN